MISFRSCWASCCCCWACCFAVCVGVSCLGFGLAAGLGTGLSAGAMCARLGLAALGFALTADLRDAFGTALADRLPGLAALPCAVIGCGSGVLVRLETGSSKTAHILSDISFHSASCVTVQAKHKEPCKPCGRHCGLIEMGLFDSSEIYEKTRKIQSSVIFADEITLAQRACSPVI